MDLGQKLRAVRLPPWPFASRSNGSKPAQKQTGTESGVSWVGNPDTSRLILLGGQTNPDAEELTSELALATSAYCFTATEYRWRTISEPPLGIVREVEDGLEDVTNNPLLPLLDDPSPDYDMGELQALTEAYRLTTGAALWVKAVDSSGALRLVPYSGDQFTTETANERIYGRFKVQTSAGTLRLGPDEVVHFRETNPGSWRSNLARLDVALHLLDLGHQVNRTVRQFMRQAMFPGGVISPHPDWNPDENEFQAYTNRIEAWHSGPANSGKPLVALGGTGFSPTAIRFRDLLPVELMNRIEATVASVYGVPPVVLGWLVGLENSPWSQMSEARRMTYEDTIEPRWRDIEKCLTRQLLLPMDRARGEMVRFDTSEVRALRADDSERAAVAAQLRDVWTLDERREYTGQEPIGGELGESIGSTSVLAEPPGEADEPDEGEEDDTEEMGSPYFFAGKANVLDEKGLAWLLFDANCKAAEGSWEREIAKVLKAQRQKVRALAKEYLKADKQTDPNSADIFLAKVAAYLEEMLPSFYTLILPLTVSTATAGVKRAASSVGIAFDVLQESVFGYAERETAFLVEKMTETTGQAVANAVQKGLEAGETVGALTKRLEGLKEFDRQRAKMTARTETTRAWNGAQRESLSNYQAETGNQILKTWLNAGDDRVRDEHLDQPDGVGGEQVPIDSVFSNGLQGPSEPNCRCTLIYAIAETVGE